MYEKCNYIGLYNVHSYEILIMLQNTVLTLFEERILQLFK
jgi:hypothetical protein